MRAVLVSAAVVLGLGSSVALGQGARQGCCEAAAPCVSYWAAGAVFVGRVEAIRRVGTSRVATFAVLEGFAGVRESTIEVTTGPVGQRCSFSFAVGKEYIVYADRSDRWRAHDQSLFGDA